MIAARSQRGWLAVAAFVVACDGGSRGSTYQTASDHRVARPAEREQRHQAMLAEFDTDGDGQLSAPERAAMRTARAKDLVARIDRNGDGKVDQAELAAAPGRASRIDLAAADQDHDGALAPAELAAAMPPHGPGGRDHGDDAGQAAPGGATPTP